MRTRFLLVLAACAGLALGGCATPFGQRISDTISAAYKVYQRVTTATVTPTQIVVVATAFDGVKSLTTTYFKYCKVQPSADICAPGTKDKPGPLRIVIQYVRSGTKARNALEPYIVSGGLGPAEIYNELVDAVNIINAQGVAQAGG